MTNQTNLYDALGGRPAIAAAVDEFYQRVLADPELAPFFVQTSIKRLVAHQNAFLGKLLRSGGYNAEAMRAAHHGKGITDREFDRVAQHLVETLRSLGVNEALIEAVISGVAPLRADVVDQAISV